MTIKYRCERCGTTYDIQNNRANGKRRLHHACMKCNDMTVMDRVAGDLREMDDETREFLRKTNPTVLITTATTTRKMHVKNGNRPLCNVDIDWREVDIEKYPKGYLDWCENCRNIIEGKQTPANHAPDTPEESIYKAIRLANNRVDNPPVSKHEYREMQITPSIYTIKQKVGSWLTAKKRALDNA